MLAFLGVVLLAGGVVAQLPNRTVQLVGIDIDNATKKVDLRKLTLSRLPGRVETDAA